LWGRPEVLASPVVDPP